MFSRVGAPAGGLGEADRPCQTHKNMLDPVQRPQPHAQRRSGRPKGQLQTLELEHVRRDVVGSRVDGCTPALNDIDCYFSQGFMNW